MNNPVQLVTNKPDKELAEDHKSNIIEASKPLMEAMNAAKKDGFITQLQFGDNAFGKIVITGFNLVKLF